jgi:serine/threonine protein kinase
VRVGERYAGGRYTVLQKLGWGHFSTVWLVHDAQTGQQAALKVTLLRHQVKLQQWCYPVALRVCL